MSLWTRFTSWLAGWPEGAPRKDHRSDKDEDMLFQAQEQLSKQHPPTKPLKLMNKRELEEYGRTIGLELDRRKTKAHLIKEIGEHSG